MLKRSCSSIIKVFITDEKKVGARYMIVKVKLVASLMPDHSSYAVMHRNWCMYHWGMELVAKAIKIEVKSNRIC